MRVFFVKSAHQSGERGRLPWTRQEVSAWRADGERRGGPAGIYFPLFGFPKREKVTKEKKEPAGGFRFSPRWTHPRGTHKRSIGYRREQNAFPAGRGRCRRRRRMRWEPPPLSEGRWPGGPEGSLALVGLIRPPSGATFPTSGEGFLLCKLRAFCVYRTGRRQRKCLPRRAGKVGKNGVPGGPWPAGERRSEPCA